MKKTLTALFLALLLTLPLCALGEAAINPDGYELIYVVDVFHSEDSEADEEGNFPPTVGALIVQACFGSVQGEADETEWIGFDETEVYALGVAEGCAFLLPPDMDEPMENAPCDDPVAWYEAAKAWYAEISDVPYTFYATFDMDENADLTRLEFAYFPWL